MLVTSTSFALLAAVSGAIIQADATPLPPLPTGLTPSKGPSSLSSAALTSSASWSTILPPLLGDFVPGVSSQPQPKPTPHASPLRKRRRRSHP
ncbi:hypothetical protein PLICRDRAFT_38500 [Plicaturopsis crispa FD-325 SS-3]|nr:hypothetical protein PLICRDRAFT_38500 [Plicaturopsis crispa FD-325 SS-3]